MKNTGFVGQAICTVRKHLFRRVTKLRKGTISFFISVRLSVRGNCSVPNGRIFIKFDTWLFFENMSKIFTFH